MPVEFRSSAERELREAKTWYRQANPGLDKKFGSRVIEAIPLLLATKIQNRSAGQWGHNVMTPPAARGVQISEAEAQSMAKYILRYR